jgi:hypothetical protein
MSDSSSITGATNPAGLPEKFTFNISHEEAGLVFGMAKRYAPDPFMGYRFQLHFEGSMRRWVMREQNITGFIVVDEDSGPESGHLTLTINVVEYIAELFKDGFDAEIEVNFAMNTLSISYLTTRIDIDLPQQDEKPLVYSLEPNSYIEVQTDELAHMGRAMDLFPIAPDMEELSGPLPFVEFVFSNGELSARRDWSDFGGPTVTITIPAIGAEARKFDSYPYALPRELFFADIHGVEGVHLCFSSETPNIAFLDGNSWGLRIELGNEVVYKYRGILVQTLSENEIDVDPDERIGWSPTINCHFNGIDVSVEIVKGIDDQADYFRLSTVVLPDAPWNLEVASEINDWNNQWTNVKLVRHETDLVALRDVTAEEMELMPAAVVDLVEKSKVVAEVVGVFL